MFRADFGSTNFSSITSRLTLFIGAIPGAIERYCSLSPIPAASSSSPTLDPMVRIFALFLASFLSMVFRTKRANLP